MKWLQYVLIFVYLNTTVILAAENPAPSVVGKIVWIQGSVSAVNAANESRPLKRLAAIYLKDTIVTAPAAGGQIVYSDNSLLTLAPDTKFTIEKYSTGTADQKPSFVGNVITGGFRTITGNIPKKEPEGYQVNTPVATLGVRGTDYAVHVQCTSFDVKKPISCKTYAAVYRGEITVKNDAGMIILNNKNPYAEVNAKDQAPTYLKNKPDVFAEKLKIEKTSFLGLGKIGSGGGGKNSGGGDDGQSSGTMSEFCISN